MARKGDRKDSPDRQLRWEGNVRRVIRVEKGRHEPDYAA